MTAYALWLCEFLLESFGCFVAFRRRIGPLWVYLGFRALADVACFAALTHSAEAYAWADLIQRTIQYPLCLVLAVYLVGKILCEQQYVIRFYAAIFAVLGTAATAFFHFSQITWGRAVRFEMWAEIVTAALLALAFFSVEGEQRKRPERVIAQCGYALLIMAGSDAALSGAMAHGWAVQGYYPMGAIAALGLWVWACGRRAAAPLPESEPENGLWEGFQEYVREMDWPNHA